MSVTRRATGLLLMCLLVATLSPLAPLSQADAAEGEKFTSPYNSAFEVTVNLVTDDRTPAVSFSNQFAGYRQVDPLVNPGQAQSDHMHAWLGSRLDRNANINALFDETEDWESGTNATDRGVGFAGQTIYKGKRDGYTSGVWWPAVWDAPPGKTPRRVTYLDGISAYYVATPQHGGQYLTAYPNGLSFLVDRALLNMDSNGRTFRVAFFGPNYWDGRNLTSSNHRSHVSDRQSASHPVAIPEFQTFLKARLGYPDDPTPLEDRIKFGDPDSWVAPHLDYVASFRQPWFHQWLLDLGPNWGHPDNSLRQCGMSMPGRLERRKLEGVRMANNIGSGGTATCRSGATTVTAGSATRPTTASTTATTAASTTSSTVTTQNTEREATARTEAERVARRTTSTTAAAATASERKQAAPPALPTPGGAGTGTDRMADGSSSTKPPSVTDLQAGADGESGTNTPADATNAAAGATDDDETTTTGEPTVAADAQGSETATGESTEDDGGEVSDEAAVPAVDDDAMPAPVLVAADPDFVLPDDSQLDSFEVRAVTPGVDVSNAGSGGVGLLVPALLGTALAAVAAAAAVVVVRYRRQTAAAMFTGNHHPPRSEPVDDSDLKLGL